MTLLRGTLRRSLPLALVGLLLLAGCSEEEPTEEAAQGSTCAPRSDETEVATEVDTSGSPPGELVVEQLAPPPAEDCPQVDEGDVVAVHYTGRSWDTGEVFDSSRDRGPFTFEVGLGQVIAGWEDGIEGLQVGERARLTIPPELAYGEAGAPPAIGPDETLVFDVEVVEVLDPPTTEPTEPTTG